MNATNLISSINFQGKLPKMKRHTIVRLSCICLNIQRYKLVHCQTKILIHVDKNELQLGLTLKCKAILQVRMEIKVTVVKMHFPWKGILQIIIYRFSSLNRVCWEKKMDFDLKERVMVLSMTIFLCDRSTVGTLWILEKVTDIEEKT